MKNKSPIDNIVNDKEKKVKPKKKDTESITKNIDSKVNKSVNKKTKSKKKESLTNKKAVIVNDSNNLDIFYSLITITSAAFSTLLLISIDEGSTNLYGFCITSC